MLNDPLHPRRGDGTCRRCCWPSKVEDELASQTCAICGAASIVTAVTQAVIYDFSMKVICVPRRECQSCRVKLKPKTVEGQNQHLI
mgnify:CR=1 FL=1